MRNLGIRYLWIDSMCIIQQEAGKFIQLDKDDWERESVTMFGVYKNSYVTLAALSGLDSRAVLGKSSNRSEAIPPAHLQFDRLLNGAAVGGGGARRFQSTCSCRTRSMTRSMETPYLNHIGTDIVT